MARRQFLREGLFKVMLQCNEIDLAAYHDRALDENVLRRVGIHLQYCPPCMSRYAEEVRLVGGLQSLPPIEPPLHFVPHVMYRVRQELYSRIVPAEERRFSLMTAGYGLALLALVVFLGGLQHTFMEVFGWARLPLKSVWAVMRTLNAVSESGSEWLSTMGPTFLSSLFFTTLLAGFMLVKLLTRYERLTLQDAQLRIHRGENDKTL